LKIYDVQILTVLCIHYWSVNVWRDRKCFGLYLLKQGRSHRLIHIMDLFKVVQSAWSNIVRLNKCV